MRHYLILPVVLLLGVPFTAFAQYSDFSIQNSRFCGLLDSGQVECTAAFTAYSPSLEPDPELRFTKIGVGNYYSCGITTSGTVECWGDEPNEGQTAPPLFDFPVVSLSVGPYHACAIDSETNLKCWGQNVHGQTDPPEPASSFIDVHAFGITTTCGVKNTGELLCWGQSPNFRLAPIVDALSTIPITQFEYDNTEGVGCAIHTDGNASCWEYTFGSQPYVQFSQGPYKDIYPLRSSGQYLSCALTINDELDCAQQPLAQGDPGSLPLTTNSYQSLSVDDGILFGIDAEHRLVAISEEVGERLQNLLATVNRELDIPTLAITEAEYYGAESGVEIFFEPLVDDLGSYILNYDTEIFRDGEFLTVTDNNKSYLDSTATSQDQYVYQLRAVHVFGQTGELSNAVTVFTSGNPPPTDPGDPEDPTTPDPSRPYTPTGLRAEVYWYDVELFWDRVSGGIVRNYEIRKNGELVATTRGTSWYDNSTENGQLYQFDVVAVGQNNEILGLDSVRVQIGEAQCTP